MSSTTASVWPGSGVVATKEKRLRVCLLHRTRQVLEEKGTAGSRQAGLVQDMGLMWFSCEHRSWTTPAHLPLHRTARATPLSLDFQTLGNSNITSATSDVGQQMLLQSFTPPCSEAVETSLCDEEALSATGKSRDTPICISDDDTNTEDESEDEGQDFDDSQSCTTPMTTSFADHLDSTGTKHSPTKSEAAISMDTTPVISPAGVEDDPVWTHDSNMDPLADPEPNQHSPCQTNGTSAGETTGCTDTDFGASPTSSESQPHLGVSDEQQLVIEATGATSEPGNMTVGAVSDPGSCHEAQSPPDSPSVCTHYARTASHVELAQTPVQDREVFVGNSCDDGIPEARTPSPARHSPEPHRGQDLDGVSCASSDAESEAAEAASGSPSETRVSSPPQELTSLRRPRRKSSQIHGPMQDKDGYADSEGSGSDGLNGPDSQGGKEDCPSLPDSPGSGSEDHGSDHKDHQGRKRRKVSRSPSNSIRNATTSVQDSRRRRRSTRTAARSSRERDTSAHVGLGPTPSQARSIPSDASAILARFEEWQLENVSMKRITENGNMTFQFQFEWPHFTNHLHANDVISNSTRSVTTRKTWKRASATRTKYSDDEDRFLIQLKEEEQLGWAEIRRCFADRFPERVSSGLQVHYCTKLKNRGRT